METSITDKTSKTLLITQKQTYKYFIRHGIQFDESNLRKQAIRNRAITTWNLSSERNANYDVEMQEKMLGIQSTKMVQKLNLIVNNSTEFSRLEKVIKQKTTLRKVSLVFLRSREDVDIELQKVMKGFGRLRTLQNVSLCLQPMGYSDEGLQRLSKGIKKLHGLRGLDLKFLATKKISDQGLMIFGTTLERLCLLESLCLTFSMTNEITNEGLKSLAKNFKGLQALKRLNLLFNSDQITGFGLQILGQSLKELTCLEDIHFCFKWALTDGLGKLAQALKTLDHPLQNITIDFSSESSVDNQMMDQIKQLSSLKNVNLESLCVSSLNDEGFQVLNQTLKHLVFLKSLHLQFTQCDQIKEEHMKQFSESLKELTCLRNFYLKFFM